MQIQRIQTLMLLIAAIFVAVFCFCPFATLPESETAAATAVFVKDAPVFLVLNIVVALLLVILIFMYKNLRQQMRMTVLSIVLICASIVTCGFVTFVSFPGSTPVLLGGVSLLVLALIFALLALRGMKHDHRLLASSSRLR